MKISIATYVYIVDSITKYVTALQHCKRKPFLHFHGNTQRSYVVDLYCTYGLTTLKKRTHCCFSMASVVTRKHYIFKWYVLRLSCVRYWSLR